MSETGVSLEAVLPLGWAVQALPSGSDLELARHGNIALLQALAAIDAVAAEREHDLPEAVQKSLERVESKLDVLLLMVAGLARAAADLPPERLVNLYHDRIAWMENTDTLSVGQRLLIRLFLSPRIPQPLLLPAVVQEVAGNCITAVFNDLGEEAKEWIARTIFRYHRRAVHARKRP